MSDGTIPFSTTDRIEYLKRYGNTTMAFSVFQRDMEYCDIPNVGFLAYRKVGNTAFALSNPICAESDREQLVGMFLEQHPKASFVQITEPFSTFLRQTFHYYTVQMGVETWIDGQTWNLSGPRKAHVRRWINTAKNDGLTVAEIGECHIGSERCVVRDNWLETRTQKRALTFLTREVYSNPAIMRLTRVFGAYKAGELIALVEFDPIFNDKNISAYYVNVVQFKKDAPNGTSDYIVTAAFKEFVREGARYLSFGMSPFARLASCRNEPPFIRWVGSWLFKNGNSFYNFRGNYFHKEKYRGEEVPVFYASRKWNVLPDVLRLFRLVGIL